MSPEQRQFSVPKAEDADDLPLQLELDDEAERERAGAWSFRKRNERPRATGSEEGKGGAPMRSGQSDDGAAGAASKAASPSSAASPAISAGPLQWALDALNEPSMAAADWLARDIDPSQPSAAALLSNPQITLEQVKQAKTVFKTMRIVGEKSADRRIGARMYAAAIAAGLVRHHQLVSRQSEAALRRGFQGLLDDRRMPTVLRDLAGMALCSLNNDVHLNGDGSDARQARSKSA